MNKNAQFIRRYVKLSKLHRSAVGTAKPKKSKRRSTIGRTLACDQKPAKQAKVKRSRKRRCKRTRK